jgi:hypothetical protein
MVKWCRSTCGGRDGSRKAEPWPYVHPHAGALVGAYVDPYPYVGTDIGADIDPARVDVTGFHGGFTPGQVSKLEPTHAPLSSFAAMPACQMTKLSSIWKIVDP